MSLFARLFGSRTPQELEQRLLPIIKMMTVDGRVDERERLALFAHMRQMGISTEQASALFDRVKNGSREITLPTDPRHRVEVMLGACAMMVIDGEISVQEVAYLHYLAGRMDIPVEVVIDMIGRAIALGQKVNPGADLMAEFEAALTELAAAVSR